jgi:uncharacterized alkaline shock family protein YloU
MAIERVTGLGNINISQEAIATLAGGVVSECYGVVGMASKQVLKDGWAELLKKGSYTKGVVVRHEEGGLAIDLYIIVSFGVKISEVVQEAQKKVKYVLENSLAENISSVNVFVQGVQVMN